MNVPTEVYQFGGAGILTLLFLKELRHWISALKKGNNKDDHHRTRCIDLPRAITAMDNSMLTASTVKETKEVLGELKEESQKQTIYLGQVVEILKNNIKEK